jgi:hypothetical protein
MISPTRSLRKLVLLALLSILRSVVAEDWLEYGSIVGAAAGGVQRNGGFGGAVAMSGTTMVVGDWKYDGDKGRVYVLSLNVDAFEEDAVLDPEETTTFSTLFGLDVAVDGDTIVVGAFGSEAAFVFVKEAGGEWTLQQRLNPSDAGGAFGFAVAVDGDRIVVGATGVNAFVGAVYVFDRSGTTWNETTILTPSDDVYSYFGEAVDVEGDTIVVGASVHNDSRGAVYVFALNGAMTWEETDILTASDGVPFSSDFGFGDSFGSSVALSGSSIAVGADSASGGNGKAYVFTRSIGPDFEEIKLLQGNATGFDRFGSSVALVGDTVVVGAPFHNGTGSNNGAIYVYKRDPTDNSWSLATKLTSSESNVEELGTAVAISGEFVVAGAWQSNLTGNNAGAVFVFESPSVEPSQSSSVVSEPQLPTLLALVLGMFLSL